MPLTDAKLRAAQAGPKPYILYDRDGLFVRVGTSGYRIWKYSLRIGGRRTTVTLGDYPYMTLRQARDARDLLRMKARAGEPVLAREKLEAAGITFADAAARWLKRQEKLWKPGHYVRVKRSIEEELNPVFGPTPLKLITAKQIAAFLTAEQARGVNDHAHDLRQRLKNIFRLAQSAGEIDHNPAEAMTAVMAPIPRAKHQPALVVREEMLEMIRQVEAVTAHPIMHAAFRLTLLTALRQGEVRFAAWKEIYDLEGEAPIWIIPGHRMKGKASHVPPDHKVPLSRQAVELLLQVREMSGESEWVFPSFCPSSNDLRQLAACFNGGFGSPVGLKV